MTQKLKSSIVSAAAMVDAPVGSALDQSKKDDEYSASLLLLLAEAGGNGREIVVSSKRTKFGGSICSIGYQTPSVAAQPAAAIPLCSTSR